MSKKYVMMRASEVEEASLPSAALLDPTTDSSQPPAPAPVAAPALNQTTSPASSGVPSSGQPAHAQQGTTVRFQPDDSAPSARRLRLSSHFASHIHNDPSTTTATANRRRRSTIGSTVPNDLYEDTLYEAHVQRRDRVEHSLLPRSIAQTTSTKESVREVFTGSFLPLMNDKFRNNIRNRPLLAAVYGVGAAFVAMLLVVLFAFPDESKWTMAFAVQPPSTIYLGTTVDTFVVQVLDSNRRGVANVALVAAVIPLQAYEVVVTLNRGFVLSHTINCPATLSEPNTGKYTDTVFCAPRDMNATWNETAVTDVHGMARFDAMLLGFGIPSTYVLVVLTQTGALTLISTVVNVKSHVVSALLTLPADFLNVSLVLDPDIEGPPRHTFNFSLDVVWRSPRPPQVVCAAMTSLNLQDNLMKSRSVPAPLLDAVNKLVDFSEYVFCTWAADITPLDDDRNATSSASSASTASSSSSSEADDLEAEITALSNLWFSSTTSDVVADACGDCPRYRATIRSGSIYLVASNTQQPFPGVNVLGTTLPISAARIESPFQVPSQIILPFAIETTVAYVVADGMPETILEGARWNDLSVRAFDASGVEINRVGFVYVGQAPDVGLAVTGVSVVHMVGINSKRILQDSFETCISCSTARRWGTAKGSSGSDAKPSFTVSGAVGYYRLYAAVDGQLAVWPSNGNRTFMTVRVLSSVDPSKSFISWVGGLGNDMTVVSLAETETIGDFWRFIPLLNIADRNNVPIQGKFFDITPRNTSSSSVIYASLGVASQGFASIYEVTTTFREGGSGLVLYDVVVDGMVLMNFTRNFTLGRYAEQAERLVSECAFVRILRVPEVFYVDVLQQLVIQAVSLNGTGIPGAVVVVETLSSRVSGSNLTYVNTADANGFVQLPIGDSAMSGICTAIASLSCFGDTLHYNWIGGVFQPRVTDVTVEFVSERTCQVTVDANWSMVSEALPVTVTGLLAWFPSYVTLWLPEDGLPVISAVNITSQADASVQITISSQANSPGLYGITPMIGYSPYNPFVAAPFNIDVASLVLIQSAFRVDNETLHMNEILPQAPMIRILSKTGAPVPGFQLFAQSMFTLPNGTIILSDADSDPQSLQYGMFLGIDQQGNAVKAVSNISGTTGVAAFASLGAVGAKPGIAIGFRYCLAVNMAFDKYDLDNVVSICVNDTKFGQFNPNQTLAFNIDQTSISGTPGQPLGEITITANVADGTVPVMVICMAFMDDFDQSLLVVPVENLFLPYATYVSFNSNELTVPAGSMLLATTALTESHSLFFVCSGGITNRVNLVVTSTPYRIEFFFFPTDGVAVRTVFGVMVEVLSASNMPLGNVPVQLSIKSQRRDCFGWQCGTVYPTSRMIATTNPYGMASFIVGMDTAGSGNYTLTASVVSVFSRPVVQSNAAANVAAITSDRGVPIADVIDECSNTSGCNPSLLTVLNELAGDTSSSLFSGPIKSLVSLIGGQRGAAVQQSIVVPVYNPVVSVEFLQQSTVTLVIPSTRSIENNFVGAAPVVFYVEASQMPRVRFTDAYGNPVAGASLTLEPIPASTTLRFVPLNSSGFVSDADGIAFVGAVTITVSSGATTLRLFVTSSGGGGNMSLPIVITDSDTFSTTDTMKMMAGMLVVFFSPMLASSVPHSRVRYLVLGAISALGSGIATILLYSYIPNNPFVEGYYYFLVVAVFALALFSVLLLALHIAGEVMQRPSCKKTNDEDKAARVLMYTQWITNARAHRIEEDRLAALCAEKLALHHHDDNNSPTTSSSAVELLPMNASNSPAATTTADRKEDRRVTVGVPLSSSTTAGTTTTTNGKKDMSYEDILSALLPVEEAKKRKIEKKKQEEVKNLRSRIAGKVNELLDEDVLDVGDDPKHRRIRRSYSLRPTLEYPPCVLNVEPIYFPFNFVIVATITLVLLVIEVFLLLYLYHFIDVKTGELLSYLPATSDSPDLLAANHFLVMLISDGISFCVTQFPTLYSMSRVLPAIRGFNVVELLANVHTVVQEAVAGIVFLFSLAGAMSTIGVGVALFLTARSIPITIRAIRRGQLHVEHSIGPIEGYIGLHCMHVVIMHQLLFWLLVMLGALLAVNLVRLALYNALIVFTAASAVGYILQFALQRVVVGLFLVSGPSLVVRPELYALWHFVGLILGVFTGLVKAVCRWAFALLSMTVLFSRLDQSIFPPSLKWLDKAHSGFMSVVALEAKNGNPIVLAFVSLLLVEKELQYLADEYYLQDKVSREEDQLTAGGGSANANTTTADAAAQRQRKRAASTTCIRHRASTSARSTPMTAAAAAAAVVCGGAGSSCTPPPSWHVSCFHLFNRDYGLSAAIKNIARMYVAARYGDPAFDDNTTNGPDNNNAAAAAAAVPLNPTPLDATTTTTTTAAHSPSSSSTVRRSEEWINGFKPFQHQWVNLFPCFNGTSCKRSRRMRIQQRWWLWVMLSLNPSLQKERKHALYTTVADDCCDDNESGSDADDSQNKRVQRNDDDDGVGEKIRY